MLIIDYDTRLTNPSPKGFISAMTVIDDKFLSMKDGILDILCLTCKTNTTINALDFLADPMPYCCTCESPTFHHEIKA